VVEKRKGEKEKRRKRRKSRKLRNFRGFRSFSGKWEIGKMTGKRQEVRKSRKNSEGWKKQEVRSKNQEWVTDKSQRGNKRQDARSKKSKVSGWRRKRVKVKSENCGNL